ncbi:PAS domain-containing sensor histidine kinase [Geodermatophilus marinus]|uniref:PAS domain-containing sensor histidine kinase n=1 Tax=Geodermatophilus sp. LHW52908 TaxID=2303986 RepID=UPI0018F7BE54|nr:histidine kinase [Geodermatophilus sp. LHW52908]
MAGPPADDRVLRALVDVCADGLAVTDPAGRLLAVNAAGAAVLGVPAGAVPVGTVLPFAVGRGRVAWRAPHGRRRDLEYRADALGDGRVAVWFADVTGSVRQQERLTAIVRAAASVADAGSLRVTLDAVAREIAMTASIAAVQILALDDPRDEVRVLGMAGFGDAADFTARLAACRERGAAVRFTEALDRRRAVVVPHRRAAILGDPRWAPLHEIMARPDWDTFVSMPMVVRGRALGVINAYYVPGEDPGPGSLDFLEAMAGSAAVAIDTAALLAQTRSRAQSDERRRLARDLHDSAVQQVFSMRMQAEALRASLERPGPDPAAVRAAAGELAALAASALADLRGLVFELRPLDLAEHGLAEAVRAHAAGMEARTGLAVEVVADDRREPDVEVDVQEDLYRIVQEALHNVVKHAGASGVRVVLAALPGGGARITVDDDGRGAGTPAGPGRLGLVSMRERAERWGGRLVAGPRPGGGWRVEVELPGAPR